MIDLERLEARLDEALADELRVQRATATADCNRLPPAPDPAPVPAAPRCRRSTSGGAAPRPRSSPAVSSPLAPAEVAWEELDIEQHGRAVVQLVSEGKLAEADLHIAAHAELAHAPSRVDHRADAIGWAVMRGLLAGHERAARAGIDEAHDLGRRAGDHERRERYWAQRLALVSTWGDDDERYEVVDQCRERAYCHGDLAWQGRLTLLLARLGRGAEAARDFDAAIGAVLGASARDAAWLDLATDLAEAAAVLADGPRGELARQGLARAGPASVVIVGRAWVCKGSVARYRALAAAAAGAAAESDGYFRSAAEAHRRLGAEVLLARTLGEWGRSLAGRDPQRAVNLLRESATLADHLGLPDRDRSLDEVA